MSPDWDLVVCGAGPAGATAALAALDRSPDLRVLMVDRATFPRDKCCGDGIAPHALDVLGGLGVRDLVDGWTPMRRLDLSHGEHRVEGRLARPVWVVPREVFDARLVARAVAAGAHSPSTGCGRCGAPVAPWCSTTPSAPGWSSGRTGRTPRASGLRGASARCRAAAGRRATRRPGDAGYAPTAPGRVGRQVIRFGDRRQPSYAWAFDRGDGLSNVGYGELAGTGAPG